MFSERRQIFSDALTEVIQDGGLSPRPGYYSGRGATTTDLRSDMLETMHKGILQRYGADAAKSFVSMVAYIEVLSATDFLLCLARLESNDWVWDRAKVFGCENGLYHDTISEAESGVISALAWGGGRDQTNDIRCSFIRNHKREVIRDGYEEYGVEEDYSGSVRKLYRNIKTGEIGYDPFVLPRSMWGY